MTDDKQMEDLKKFTTQFFTYFGSTFSVKGEQIEIELSSELADYFGKPMLTLVFHPHHLTEDADLVTHGSFMLGKICDYLLGHGQAMYAELPRKTKAQKKIPPEFNIVNTVISRASIRSEAKYCYVFNFKIDYISDEKIGELYSMGLDWKGNPWAPPEFKISNVSATQIPSADIHEAYDVAVKHVEDHVKKQSVDIEKDILQRLFKQINRLDVFYSEQIEDLRSRRSNRGVSEIQDQIDHLQEEFKLKVAEETDNHRLRVKINIVSYQVWKVPFQKHIIMVNPNIPKDSESAEEIEIVLMRDLFTGKLEATQCDVCDVESTKLLLCHNQHLTCEQHTHECMECGKWECEKCGISKCATCGIYVCTQCGKKCQSCNNRLCNTHQLHCHIDGEGTCKSCSAICKNCQQITCHQHLENCAICRAQTCPDCIRECSFCYAHACNEHISKCDTCGQYFCANCIRASSISGKLFCRTHSVTCSTCGKSFSQKEWQASGTKCSIENEYLCASCEKICDACGKPVCPEHSYSCKECHKTFCLKDAVVCHVCQTVLCTAHHAVCPDCDKIVCADHLQACSICSETFCKSCLDNKGRCTCCKNMRFIVAMFLPAMIKKAEVPDELKKCANWRRSTSKFHEVYLGFHDKKAYVVVFDQSGKLIRYRIEKAVEIMKVMMESI